MKTKKAISDIVSTVLIIMIAVAAVGIIGAVVVPMVRNSLQSGTTCLNALSDVSIENERTCFSQNETVCIDGGTSCSSISVQVRKGTDVSVELTSIVVQVMDSSGNSEPYIQNTTGHSLGGVRTYLLENVANDAVSITLAPVVKQGSSLKTCDPLIGQIMLVPCSN